MKNICSRSAWFGVAATVCVVSLVLGVALADVVWLLLAIINGYTANELRKHT